MKTVISYVLVIGLFAAVVWSVVRLVRDIRKMIADRRAKKLQDSASEEPTDTPGK